MATSTAQHSVNYRAREAYVLTTLLCAALIEAILGFQCNHVGGGTKTRRPITLHMKYNSSCVQPSCTLVTEENGDQQVSLEELQASL